MADGQPVNGMYSDVMARHTAAAAVRVESPTAPPEKGVTPFSERQTAISFELTPPSKMPLVPCRNPNCRQGPGGAVRAFVPKRFGQRRQIYCCRTCKDSHQSTRLRERIREARENLNRALLAGIVALQAEGELRSMTFEVEDGRIR